VKKMKKFFSGLNRVMCRPASKAMAIGTGLVVAAASHAGDLYSVDGTTGAPVWDGTVVSSPIDGATKVAIGISVSIATILIGYRIIIRLTKRGASS
jgi:outer membrane protein assembly factor BamB